MSRICVLCFYEKNRSWTRLVDILQLVTILFLHGVLKEEHVGIEISLITSFVHQASQE